MSIIKARLIALTVLVLVAAPLSFGNAVAGAKGETGRLSDTYSNPSALDIVEWLPQEPADHRIRHGDGPLQFGDLRLPRRHRPGGHPVVIFVHGGGWSPNWGIAHSHRLVEALNHAGIATWNIEYRRPGHSGGGWPGTFTDVGTAVDHLRELADRYNLDLSRVVVSGHSAGGHLALWIAARKNIPADSPLFEADPLPIKGVVALAGVPDLERFPELAAPHWRDVFMALAGAETEQELAGRYDEISPRHMLPLAVPQILIQGDSDGSVPVAVPTEYAGIARQFGDHVELVILEGANHFDLIEPCGPAWSAVAGSILAVLGEQLPNGKVKSPSGSICPPEESHR